MSNICTNSLKITGPISAHVLLALTIATGFIYNPLKLNLAVFDPEIVPLPETLSNPDHAFIGDCAFTLTDDGELECWADSKGEPPLDWLEAMTLQFPTIRLELEYLEPSNDVAGRAVAFNRQLDDQDEPADTFAFSRTT